ncbi:zinc-binding alcohol dehydrogenase [Caldicoprobacter algeriensis]|uniref:zinc-dependent alcohol dehydrogenase n=1 Tax=Caldicoprobacter algeriensis TaxID=699281 RepID=UPI00207AE03A|nr:zinc-binding alcohol dehydrogenase [Caldicoprobacter algeriensis]MCM8900432.1 zinc-binding alcohol dehydrogenase [Caldicoprobacter algeriensis]
MPRQLVAVAPRVAAIVEYEDREIMPNEVKVKVEFASPKHGTELTDFRGQSPFIKEKYDPEWQLFLPREDKDEQGVKFGEWNLGNQWVGRIIEKGADVKDFEIGDRVCSYGGIRETHIVNAVNNYRLRKVPENVSWKNAVCYDPAQFALGGVRDANIRPGDRVAVFGLGAIGQIAAQICKKLGASLVVVVDPIELRRNVALKNGADVALDPNEVDVGFELKKLTDKMGVDAVIETSGHVSALQHALRGLAYGGTISYVAFAKEFGGLNLGREAHFNNGRIIFSRACSEPNPDYPRWNRRRIEDVCWKMLMEGYLQCEDIVYPVVPFEECAEAYMKFVDREPHLSIKMGVKF